MGLIMAHGVAAHSHFGDAAAARLQRAMEQAILQCNAEGITNTEENSPLIARRMRLAHQTELLAITREEHARAAQTAQEEYQRGTFERARIHQEHIATMDAAFQEEVSSIEATIEEAR